MDAQTVTVISGIALLIVFVLVGVYVRRHGAGGKSRNSIDQKRSGKDPEGREKKG